MKVQYKEYIAFFSIAVVLVLVKFPFHELWKDEWQSWLVARDMGWGQMLGFINYEGHPSLWYLYLKPFTWFSDFFQEDILLKVAHILPVIAGLFIFFIYFNIPFVLKLLYSLSYFVFFEYGVICRGYTWVILLGFVAVYAIQRQRSFLLYSSLFLLCQAEVYGCFIAMILVVYLYFKETLSQNVKKAAVSLLVGLMAFAITVFPRGYEEDFKRAYNKKAFSSEVVYKSIQGNLANTFGIGTVEDTAAAGHSSVGLLLSLIILALTVWFFADDKKLRNSWILATLLFLSFGIFFYAGGVRQWGMFYIVFICLLVLYEPLLHRKKNLWLSVLLGFGPLLYNVRAVTQEVTKPFTNAREAGAFIKDLVPVKVPVVSLNKFETANAAAYAERKFYELPSGEPFSYFRWLERVYVPTQTELILFAKYKGVRGLVVISSRPIDDQRFPFLKLWKAFKDDSIKKENYYLYVLSLEQLGS